jgi:hypothetical protein
VFNFLLELSFSYQLKIRGTTMAKLTMVLIGLSAISFLLAVISILVTGPIMGITPEGFSRACTNLVLMGIALSVCCPKQCQAPD